MQKLENSLFSHPPHLMPQLMGNLLEFPNETYAAKTRGIGLLSVEHTRLHAEQYFT